MHVEYTYAHCTGTVTGEHRHTQNTIYQTMRMKQHNTKKCRYSHKQHTNHFRSQRYIHICIHHMHIHAHCQFVSTIYTILGLAYNLLLLFRFGSRFRWRLFFSALALFVVVVGSIEFLLFHVRCVCVCFPENAQSSGSARRGCSALGSLVPLLPRLLA